MEAFGYLAVFYSIILGLAITRVLSGFAELVNLRQAVRWYAPFAFWGAFLLFYAAWEWWVIFRWHTHKTWSFPLYGFLAIRPSLIYFATHLLLPDFEIEREANLREQLWRVRRWLFAIVGVIVLLGIADSALKGSDYFHSIWSWQWPLSSVLIALTISGMIVTAEWVQWLLPLVMLGAFGYFALISTPMQ